MTLLVLLSPTIDASAKPVPPSSSSSSKPDMEQELEADRQQLLASRGKLAKDLTTAEASTADLIKDQIKLLDMQLEALDQTLKLLRDAKPAMAAAKAKRQPVAESVRAVLAPVAAANVPAWLPDDIVRNKITHAQMRCPAGATILEHDTGLSCMISGVKGKQLGVRDGLTVEFVHSGKLSSQRLFDRGKLRWSIQYHLSSGRESVGFYVGREKFEYTEHGIHTRYNVDGSVQSQVEYDHGKPHGWTRLYDQHGFPIVAERYEKGVVAESVYPDGRRVRAGKP